MSNACVRVFGSLFVDLGDMMLSLGEIDYSCSRRSDDLCIFDRFQ